MTLGPPKEPALVQLRHQEAKGAKIQARVQGNHHADREAKHPREHGVAGEQEDGGDQPDRATDHSGDAACLVVLVNVVPFEQAGRLERPLDELPDDIGRPPEAAHQHDEAGDRDQQAAGDTLEDEPGRDQDDHRPLVRLPGRPIVQGQLTDGVCHKLTFTIHKLNNLRLSV